MIDCNRFWKILLVPILKRKKKNFFSYHAIQQLTWTTERRAKIYRKMKLFIYRIFYENSRNVWLRSELSRIENYPPDL